MRRFGTLFLVIALTGVAVLSRASGADTLRWGRLGLVSVVPVDSTAWVAALDLEGRPVEPGSLEEGIRRGLHALARAGYPFAEARPGNFSFLGDLVTCIVVLDPGPRARLEALELPGARVTQPGTARRVAGVRPGAPYTGEEDARIGERLSRSGLFSRVGEAELVPGTAPDAVRLRVPVEEPPYTRFRGVLGVSGRDARLTGLLDLDLANIAGTGRAASGRWENRGEGLTRYSLRYREPWLPVVGIGLLGSLVHDVNESVYSYTNWEIVGDLLIAGQWTIRFGRGGARAVETMEVGVTGRAITEGYFLAGVDLDRRDSARNPEHGFHLTAESRRGTKTFTPDTMEVHLDRTRWELGGDGYRRVGRRWLGVLRGRFEYLDTPEDSVPRWDLVEVGGAGSLRGYREDQFLTLGTVILQGEWRLRQDERGSAIYAFADAGFIQEEGRGLGDLFDRFLLGTGLGIRQAKGPGILSLEYGIPTGESPLDGRLHLRLDAVF